MNKLKGLNFTWCIGLLIVNFCYAQEYRTIDGSYNNTAMPELGKVYSELRIATYLDYEDGIARPNGEDRKSPREISNVLFAQNSNIVDEKTKLSDFTWAFADFIHNDIAYVPENKNDLLILQVPHCDPTMDPECKGEVIMPFKRSKFIRGTGTGVNNPRKFQNDVTTWLDASTIYGSSLRQLAWLRTFENGKLKTSEENMLPFNTTNGLLNGPLDINAPVKDINVDEKVFVSGDLRVNHNVGLTSIHTLFHREHNRQCDLISSEFPGLSDEEVFQIARERVIALIQSITFYEFLPSLGIELPAYRGYQPDLDPRISNVNSATAFHYSYTMMNPTFKRFDDNCQPIRLGNLTMKDAFSNPNAVLTAGVDPIIKGLLAQQIQKVDCAVVDDLRNFKYVESPTETFGHDLVAFTICRSRERGIPNYVNIRQSLGLPLPSSFDEITTNKELARNLEIIYDNVENIDSWVGLMAESHNSTTIFGETLTLLIKDQFTRLRDADRFYFESNPNLTEEQIEEFKQTTLSDIILRNTDFIDFVQENAFQHEPICLPSSFNQTQILDFNVHPNPTADKLYMTVYMRQSCNAEIHVTDIHGKSLLAYNQEMKEGFNPLEIEDISVLDAGVYFIQISIPRGAEIVKRFVKIQ